MPASNGPLVPASEGERPEPTPRTIAGRALLSGLRPHIRRGRARTIVTIEDQATALSTDAMRGAEELAAAVAELDPGVEWDPATRADLVKRALELRDR